VQPRTGLLVGSANLVRGPSRARRCGASEVASPADQHPRIRTPCQRCSVARCMGRGSRSVARSGLTSNARQAGSPPVVRRRTRRGSASKKQAGRRMAGAFHQSPRSRPTRGTSPSSSRGRGPMRRGRPPDTSARLTHRWDSPKMNNRPPVVGVGHSGHPGAKSFRLQLSTRKLTSAFAVPVRTSRRAYVHAGKTGDFRDEVETPFITDSHLRRGASTTSRLPDRKACPIPLPLLLNH